MLKKRKHHGPIAIDIGAAGVKLLQFTEHDGHPAILAAAHEHLHEAPEDSAGRFARVRQAVENCLRRNPFIGRDVVCALGTGEFQMKNIRLPKMPDEELAGAVEFEAQDRFELGGRPAQIRHLTAGEVRHGNEIKQEVIVFAAVEDAVQRRLELLESFKLRPIAVDLTPCCAARGFVRFLRRAEDVTAVNVFVDVGWRGSTVIIVHGMEIAFLKQVEVGGLHFTNAVAKGLNLEFAKALDLRIRRMQGSAGRRNHERTSMAQEIDLAASDAVRPLIEKLLKDIQLCLRYFAVTFRGQRPECVTLVGGDAAEPTLVKTFTEEVDMECMIGNPLRGIANPGALGSQEAWSYQPAWAVACGLALRGSPWVKPVPTTASVLADGNLATA